MNNTVRLKKGIVTAILAALSIVLYVIGPKFPLPAIFPSFLSVNFSMVPIFIALLTMGYKSGLVIVIIRFLFKLMSTSTAGIGETADLIIGLILILFTSLGYFLFKSKGKYIPMFLFAIIGWILGGVLSNVFALPMYIKVMGFTPETFASMLSSIHPACTVDNYIFYYFVYAIIPFNALLAGVVVIVTYFVWLPLHKYTDDFFGKKMKNSDKNENLDDSKSYL